RHMRARSLGPPVFRLPPEPAEGEGGHVRRGARAGLLRGVRPFVSLQPPRATARGGEPAPHHRDLVQGVCQGADARDARGSTRARCAVDEREPLTCRGSRCSISAWATCAASSARSLGPLWNEASPARLSGRTSRKTSTRATNCSSPAKALSETRRALSRGL